MSDSSRSSARPDAEGPRPRGAWDLASGLLALLAICLVPTVVGASLYLQLLRERAVSEAYGVADLVAAGTTERLHWLLADAQAMLASVAARPLLLQAAQGGACDPILQEFRPTSPVFKTLSLRLADGRSLCSAPRDPPAQGGVAASAWFRAGLQHGGFHVSDGHVGDVTATWTVRLTHPVLDANGQVQALLVTPVDLDLLQKRLFAQLRPEAVVTVLDGANRVVVRSTQQAERLGKEAAPGVARLIDDVRRDGASSVQETAAARQFADVGTDGKRRLYVVQPLAGTDWMVVAGVDEERTLQSYRQARDRSLQVIVTMLLVAGFAAWVVSQGIRRPVAALARAARALSRGERIAPVAEIGPTELRTVAREFNAMVAATTLASQQLMASEQRYRALLEQLPVAVLSYAGDGTLQLFNARSCAVLGIDAEQLSATPAGTQGWALVDAQGARVDARDHPAAQVLRTGHAMAPTTYGVVRAEGNAPHAWVLATAYLQPAAHGAPDQAVVVLVDITAQREGEQMRLAKESAEAASSAKSKFLSRLSHELRTPLNAIIGFSQLMHMDPQLPARHRTHLGHVLQAGDMLLQLINQVLDISSIEAGRPIRNMQPVPLRPMIDACVAMCGPLARQMGVALQPPEGPAGAADLPTLAVQSDPTCLQQILVNLLSNAIKYNRPHGVVTTAIRLEDHVDGARVLVDITDSGIGLDALQIERLFEPFNRVGAERTPVEGHGIGLAHARALARSMGGDITVRSTPGEGSCFTLHLSMAPAAAASV